MNALQGLRILVVENDEMSATLLEMQLAQSGAIVVGTAATVADALRLVDTASPQIVLLDYRLAHHETSDPVAERLAAQGLPFVVVTGMAPHELPDAFRAGVVLVKPYLTKELEAALANALQDHPVAS